MPRKSLDRSSVSTLVQERLTLWGRSIHTQRMRQRIQAADLAARIGVSPGTLRRLEAGDPGASAAAYLAALVALGVADEAAPPLAAALWSDEPRHRVRSGAGGVARDDDYF